MTTAWILPALPFLLQEPKAKNAAESQGTKLLTVTVTLDLFSLPTPLRYMTSKLRKIVTGPQDPGLLPCVALCHDQLLTPRPANCLYPFQS
jgi:hypothetical protein